MIQRIDRGREPGFPGELSQKEGIRMKIAVLIFAWTGIGMLAWGQGSTAQIRGVIRDASGSVVAGAGVKVTQTATGAVRNTVTGDDGAYTLPSLPVGPYLFEVSKEGFAKYVQSGIVLE